MRKLIWKLYDENMISIEVANKDEKIYEKADMETIQRKYD